MGKAAPSLKSCNKRLDKGASSEEEAPSHIHLRVKKGAASHQVVPAREGRKEVNEDQSVGKQRENRVTHQIVRLARECSATEIPSGDVHSLAAGTPVIITQQLGGSYTVSAGYGQLMRIEMKDADALGFAVAAQESSAEFSEQLVWDQLKTVYDPEIPVNIVDLGLVYSCDITEKNGAREIYVAMTMTAPGCGMSQVLKSDVERKLSNLPTVRQVNVEIVFDPPWTMQRMSEATRLQLGLDY